MAVPSKQIPGSAPPPLPPPTRITDLENGHDTGWFHANSNARLANTKLPPINPSSSLVGGHYRPEPVDQPDPMVIDEPEPRPNRPSFSGNTDARIKIEPPLLSVSTNFSGSL